MFQVKLTCGNLRSNNELLRKSKKKLDYQTHAIFCMNKFQLDKK